MRQITQEEFDKIIKEHEEKLENGIESNLDFHDCNLSESNLSYANLCQADLTCTNLSYSDMMYTNLGYANLTCARLIGANMLHADMQRANMLGADMRHTKLNFAFMKNTNMRDVNIDYSDLPLWCGSLHTHFDDRQLKQIAYHLVSAGLNSKNASEETKMELNKLVDFANGFHRAVECELLEKYEGESK